MQWMFTFDALNLFSHVCAFIQRAGFLTRKYKTHILEWEHRRHLISDSFPENKQKIVVLILVKKILRVLVDMVKLKERTCVKEKKALLLFRVLKCYL